MMKYDFDTDIMGLQQQLLQRKDQLEKIQGQMKKLSEQAEELQKSIEFTKGALSIVVLYKQQLDSSEKKSDQGGNVNEVA